MQIDDAKEAIKERWRELWPADKGRGKAAGVVCPLCGSGSGANGSGVKEDRNTGAGHFLKCFACGFAGDAVSLIGAEMKKSLPLRGADFVEAVREGARRLGLPLDDEKPRAAAPKAARPTVGKKDQEKDGDPRQDFTAFCAAAAGRLEDAREYIEGRGISLETAAAYGLGFDAAWKRPQSGKQEGRRLIVPFAGGVGYLARAIDDGQENAKLNGGKVGLFGDVDAMAGGGVVFVCEGWADALSVIEAGKVCGEDFKAVSIQGAGQANIFLDAAKGFTGVFLIGFDNDKTGREDAAKLHAMLTEAGFLSSVVDICAGLHDANECFQQERDAFVFACLAAFTEGRAAAEKAARPDSIMAYIDSGSWRADVERGKANREKTGFPAFDAWLGGGLYEGLLVVSGFPSLGKSSLLWQMAESVAAGGCHVLFFALEMARADMLAKSLSRRAWGNGRDVTSDDAQSGRDDCRKELEEMRAAVGDRLEVVEGSFGYDVGKILERARRAKRMTGGRLAVFVDYLQACVIFGSKAENAAIGETAKAFRQMARELQCPVICASSTARTGYECAVGYSSFYGSGGIESAADAAGGLQLSLVYTRDFAEAGKGPGGKERQAAMIEKAANEARRRVSFIGLKNRRGVMRRRVDFLFDARHCSFSEVAGAGFGQAVEDDIPFSSDELAFE